MATRTSHCDRIYPYPISVFFFVWHSCHKLTGTDPLSASKVKVKKHSYHLLTIPYYSLNFSLFCLFPIFSSVAYFSCFSKATLLCTSQPCEALALQKACVQHWHCSPRTVSRRTQTSMCLAAVCEAEPEAIHKMIQGLLDGRATAVAGLGVFGSMASG